MPKKKERNSEEFYRGKLREAQKQIRQLERSLKLLSRRPVKETDFTKEKKNEHICPDCGKGKLEIFEIIGKVFEICKLCGYRKKLNGEK